MQQSTIPFLLTSLIVTLFLGSCATNNVVSDYKKVDLEKTFFTNPYFSNPETDYVYKTNIEVYGNSLSGIFIAKKINETTHRVVFTTEFGNKLLDFEISENDFKINSIVDELNKKMLVNTLKTDFRLLLKKDFVVNEQFENENEKVYQSSSKNKFNYIYVSKPNNYLTKIIHSTKRKEKININFITKNNIFAEHILIQHNTIKLKIELNYFKNN